MNVNRISLGNVHYAIVLSVLILNVYRSRGCCYIVVLCFGLAAVSSWWQAGEEMLSHYTLIREIIENESYPAHQSPKFQPLLVFHSSDKVDALSLWLNAGSPIFQLASLTAMLLGCEIPEVRSRKGTEGGLQPDCNVAPIRLLSGQIFIHSLFIQILNINSFRKPDLPLQCW